MRATTVAQAVAPSKRVVALAMVASLVALSLGAGGAAAHNPADKQVAGDDGPHYDDSDRTGSETAYRHNPNLMSPDDPESEFPEGTSSAHTSGGH